MKACFGCKIKAGALKCSACRFAVYCSTGCQKSHWKNGHKNECCAHAKQNIHAASFRGDERMIRDLQAEFPALSMDWVHPVDGGTAALVATQEGHVRCLKLLSERGADLTAGPIVASDDNDSIATVQFDEIDFGEYDEYDEYDCCEYDYGKENANDLFCEVERQAKDQRYDDIARVQQQLSDSEVISQFNPLYYPRACDLSPPVLPAPIPPGRRGPLNQIYVQAFARLECVISANLFQRRGIATDQLHYMAHVFQPTFKKILYVATTNMAGMALYSKCGWSVVSEPLPVDFQDCAPGADDMTVPCPCCC